MNYPEELLIELSKDFPNSPIPGVIFVRSGDFDSCIYDLHNEFSIVFPSLLLFNVDLETICINQVIVLILHPVDLEYGLTHARSPARSWSLRVVVRQVG